MRMPSLVTRYGRSVLIVIIGTAISLFLVRMTEAGSLTPADVPTTATFYPLGGVDGIFDALASDSYDSSLITADPNGSALEISRCIIEQLTGGTCP